jgi:hypothetical protein
MQIEISKETFKQLSEFARFSRHASDMELPLNQMADLLIQIGIDHMVASVLAPQDVETVLNTILQLGPHHPKETFGYMADVMLRGKEINEAKLAEMREQMQRRIGFKPPNREDNERE